MSVNWTRWFPWFVPSAAATWAPEARILRWLTLFWLAVGMAILFSASYAVADTLHGDGLYYCKRQAIWLLAGLAAFQFLVSVPLRYALYVSSAGFALLLGLMWTLLVPGLGTSAYGAVRWIAIGSLPIQPSELLKPFLVLYSAQVLGRWERLTARARWIWAIAALAVLFGILLQPNLSTAVTCGLLLWLMALAAGLPMTYLWGTAIAGSALALLSISLREYQQRRIAAFLDPWADPLGNGYQLVQSLLAIGSGGLTGTGFGLSQQKLVHLPIQYTDFIFSVFAEEFGLLGTSLLLGLLLLYAAVGCRVVLKTRDRVHRLVAVGAIVLLIGQSLINMGVATGMLPTTGLPFPLLSYGGSSAIANLILAGLLVRTARESTAAAVVNLGSKGERDRKVVPFRARSQSSPPPRSPAPSSTPSRSTQSHSAPSRSVQSRSDPLRLPPEPRPTSTRRSKRRERSR